jgi:hypothetical protein
MDMGSMDAIINSCQKGQICSCPRAKLKRIDPESACGKAPVADYNNLSAASVKAFSGQVEVFKKCTDDVFETNLKIYKYNEIFDRCQKSESSSSFKNKPPREIYSGDGKTLNEQVQDVKAAERAQEQALREEEAAGQAEEDRAYAAAHRPVGTEPTTAQPAQQPPQRQQPAEELDACLAAVNADPGVISLRIGSNMNLNCRTGSYYARWSACTEIIIPACIAAINSGAFSSR